MIIKKTLILDGPEKGLLKLIWNLPSCNYQIFHCFDEFIVKITSFFSSCILKEITQDLSTQMLATSFLMVHDSTACCQDHITKIEAKLKNRRKQFNINWNYPNWRDGRRVLVHFSMSRIGTSKRGEIIPALLSLPVRFTTTFPARWSSTTSNSPM